MEVKQRYQIIHQVRMKGLHWRNQANLQRPSKCTSHFGFSLGLQSRGGDISKQLEKQIEDFFDLIDRKVKEGSEERGLFPPQVRLLQPIHFCVLVGETDIFVVLSVHEVGAVAIRQFVDWSGKPMNVPTATFLAERDLAFKNAFAFRIIRSVLDLEEKERDTAAARIAEQYLKEEVLNLEREQRIVRLNPIFQGRYFLINEQLVFVLSPFTEPFNTIYEDHIKPSVEGINNITCLRADDIYDTRPIVEDIWRCTNEARILIAELTGRNPNVSYETGIAHTVGKEVILLTQTMDDVPFDLKHLRCIVYEYTPKGHHDVGRQPEEYRSKCLGETSIT